MKKEVLTNCEEDSYNLAKEMGKEAQGGIIFALTGELGTGKTILAKGIASGMGITEDITSPTFNLLDVHPGKIPLYHFDLYRIESEDELDNLFFEEYWEGDGVSVIEWADRAGNRLPETAIKISLEYINESSRRITIEYPDN